MYKNSIKKKERAKRGKVLFCKMLRQGAYVPKTLKVKPFSLHEITKAVPYF